MIILIPSFLSLGVQLSEILSADRLPMLRVDAKDSQPLDKQSSPGVMLSPWILKMVISAFNIE